MPEPVKLHGMEIAQLLDDESLREWIQLQRWYASKSRAISAVEIVEQAPLRDEPLLLLTLVQTRFATGTHELYQLPLALRPAARRGGRDGDGSPAVGQGPPSELIARVDDWDVYDGLSDPEEARELLRRVATDDEIETLEGRFSFQRIEGFGGVPADAPARLMGVEQSNSSVVFGDTLVLKAFRKLEPGVNPELEVLRFLTLHGFENIAPLQGWWEYEGQALAATLGVVQSYLPEAIDGWELALDEIVSAPEVFLERLSSLGEVTAEMHNVLASDSGDPAFSPEEPSQEAMSLLTATVDEDIERIFVRLPDDERVAPILGRGEDVRERLAARAQIGTAGRSIRTHGDYHLGQTLATPRGWVIIDFEGEPARALPERRQKRSPLRDVASMLRSFAYVTSATEILGHRRAPEDFEQRARERFLGRYLERVDPTLMPSGDAQIMNLLSIFELEKAIYELQYELDNRPDWVAIPVAGIRRLLESS
jgi:maltokinase